jgi:uncharacterized protein DUF6058
MRSGYVAEASVPVDTFPGYGRAVRGSALEAAVTARFLAINGDHPMTPEDDSYVNEWFLPVPELAEQASVPVDELRRLMLTNRIPLPSYLRSDGAQMVAPDLLDLAERAGGVDRLPSWFASHFPDPRTAISEWDAYLAGQYVCLRSVTPDNMKRKDELVDAIEHALDHARPESGTWRSDLHRLVDALDELEPPFAPYDRLRFGGPVSRDRLIDAARARFPRLAWSFD